MNETTEIILHKIIGYELQKILWFLFIYDKNINVIAKSNEWIFVYETVEIILHKHY